MGKKDIKEYFTPLKLKYNDCFGNIKYTGYRFLHINGNHYAYPTFYSVGMTHNADITLLSKLRPVKTSKDKKHLYFLLYYKENNIFSRGFEIGFKHSTFNDTNAWMVYSNKESKWVDIRNIHPKSIVYHWVKLRVPAIDLSK